MKKERSQDIGGEVQREEVFLELHFMSFFLSVFSQF